MTFPLLDVSCFLKQTLTCLLYISAVGIKYPLFDICCCLVTKSCPTLCKPMDCVACQGPLTFSISQSLLKFMPIESIMLSNPLILCHLLLLCLQSFPASGSFPMDWLLTSGGQSIGASASSTVLPMNFQDCFL